jgi:hypothetical protein
MTIGVRTRRDVVIMDPDRFLPPREALRDLNPELTDAQADGALTDVTDAVHALLDRDGQLALDHIGAATRDPEPGRGRPLQGVRVSNRPDGLSPAGWLQQICARRAGSVAGLRLLPARRSVRSDTDIPLRQVSNDRPPREW